MVITKLLGIKYPVFQGGMAQIARHELASAVSNAGGLGIIASGGMSIEQIREEIINCKKHTDKPFAVNLMLMMHNIDEIIDVVIEDRNNGCRDTKKIYAKIKRSRYKSYSGYPVCKSS